MISRFGCEQTRSFLNAYIDCELLIETNMQMAQHLQGCRSCTELVQERIELKRQVRDGVRTIRAPAALVSAVRAKLQANSI